MLAENTNKTLMTYFDSRRRRRYRVAAELSWVVSVS